MNGYEVMWMIDGKDIIKWEMSEHIMDIICVIESGRIIYNIRIIIIGGDKGE